MTRSRKSTDTAAQVRPDGRSQAHSLVSKLSGDLVRRIHDGSLAVGARLPSVRRYAQECDVSNETVLRVYDKLVALHYLQARRGAGFFVVRNQPPSEDRQPPWTGASEQGNAWKRVLYAGVGEDTAQIGLGGGALPAAWMDHEAMDQALRDLQRAGPAVFSNHVDPHGLLPLRQQLQRKLLEQGIQVPASQIVTTSGATDALHLVIWSHFYPREYVVVEDPAPFLYIERLLASGLEIVRVPRQHDGPDLEALQAACKMHKPRAFFTSSLLQSPCSTSMSPYKAHQVLKIADAHDMLIIDDDTYGDLLPPGASSSVARLAALDKLERVIHIGSFSKTVAPGLRTGFLAASPKRIERILLYRSVGAIHGPLLTDLFMHQLLAQGGYRGHCEALQAKLDTARGGARQTLETLGCHVAPTQAGMYLWADLGVDADVVARHLDERGIPTAPGATFLSRDERSSQMRFNVASVSMQAQAMRTLAEVLFTLRA
jgi:DNA-binding transcriptional MocR family regulator